MFAARAGHVEIVMLLADKKAKLDLQNKMGWSALMYSAENGHIDVLCMLLKRGANPDLVTPKNITALMIAADNYKSTGDCKVETKRSTRKRTAKKKFDIENYDSGDDYDYEAQTKKSTRTSIHSKPASDKGTDPLKANKRRSTEEKPDSDENKKAKSNLMKVKYC